MNLRRDLGLVDAIAVGLGAIIGAGIFVVTGVAARVAGPAFILGLLIAAVAAGCNALSSAQLAAKYPQSGGTYEYGYRVLTPWFGFAAGWTFVISKLAAGGTVALGFASYFQSLVPETDETVVALLAVVTLTIANLFGIKRAGRLNTWIVSISLISLVYFVVSGIPHFESASLTPFAPNGVSGILESAALLFFAYTGFARVATLGEEVRDPSRTIPRAIITALSIAVVLYLAVSLVALGGAGAEELGDSNAPLLTAAEYFDQSYLPTVLVVAGAAAMLGVLLSQILGISRVVFAMSRRGDLPILLSRISIRYAVPHLAIVLTGAIICFLAFFGSIQAVIAAATFAILLYYGITNFAALKMAKEDKLFHDSIPAVGLCSCLLLAFSLRTPTIISGITLLVVGLSVRWLWTPKTIANPD